MAKGEQLGTPARNNSRFIRLRLIVVSLQNITTSVSTASGQKPVSYKLFSLPLYAVDRLPSLLDLIRGCP